MHAELVKINPLPEVKWQITTFNFTWTARSEKKLHQNNM